MLALFNLLPIAWRLIAIGGAIAALIAAYAYWHHHVYEQGYSAAIADVAKADAAALERVKVGQGDVANCRAGHGEWDVTTGTCK